MNKRSALVIFGFELRAPAGRVVANVLAGLLLMLAFAAAAVACGRVIDRTTDVSEPPGELS